MAYDDPILMVVAPTVSVHASVHAVVLPAATHVTGHWVRTKS